MKHSAGILLYSWRPKLHLLLAHPGGPYWKNKDQHGWSIPKGEFNPELESAIDAACREFKEELGFSFELDDPVAIPAFKSSGKTFHFFLTQWNGALPLISSNYFELEWPPKSGTLKKFPEIDKVGWFTVDVAFDKIHKGQRPALDWIKGHLESLKARES